MKPASSNLASSWGLSRPIIKLHPYEKKVWPWVREVPQNLGFPFNSVFKISMQLGSVKGHNKILPKRKSGHGPALWELPKIWGFPFNISATAETSDFRFGKPLEFAKAHHTSLPRRKVGVLFGWGAVIIFGVPLNIFAMAAANDFKFGTQLGFAKAYRKITLTDKMPVDVG